MTTIKLHRNKGDNITAFTAFTVKGHAGFDLQGKDIVCAAVSAIVQTAVLGLQLELGEYCQKRMSDGWLQCKIFKDNRTAEVIVSTMVVGLQEIERQYPGHVEIEN